MMRSVYKIVQLFDKMYPISKIFEILRQGVDCLVHWLEQWISTGDPGSSPVRDAGFLSNYASSHCYDFFIFVNV